MEYVEKLSGDFNVYIDFSYRARECVFGLKRMF